MIGFVSGSIGVGSKVDVFGDRSGLVCSEDGKRRSGHRVSMVAVPESRASAAGTSTTASRLWKPASWREMPIRQVPDYPDLDKLHEVESRLSRSLPLVFSGECERLKQQIAKAGRGEAFVIQGGDCAESFEEFRKYGGDNIKNTFTLLIQMSIVMMYGTSKPIVKIGRMAGQFAKPRSSPFESGKNKEMQLPSYRGDMINGPDFTIEDRSPDPERMWEAFMQSTATINLLRTLATGGYLDLRRIHDINLEFVNGTEQGARFRDFANSIMSAIKFMHAVGLQTDSPMIRQAEFYVSHEALLLPYEEALTRFDETTGKHYATSGHFIWLGDRTRQPEGAHVEFLRGIANPIGVKCGPTLSRDDLCQLLDILNPDNEPGRITLITRVGAGNVREHLPRFIETVQKEGYSVTWSCDAMHGNTESSPAGYKTRNFKNIYSEVEDFLSTHMEMGTCPGGIHLEMTGQNVTECVGGMMELSHDDLRERYETGCDPRLNASQALELAFLVSEMISRSEKS
uniref:Phospho-2-dehydro-3-deoxyheptonate aldolase n=1 Tax=Timspurckia oligopyrenoides TaxID=708627 RepID=A0A7S0ZL63_9RHOD|mmetsp:Transcript_9399/g.16959  ORF Transcript_9399/g.16959 Transcript_9399/m.16959 type:complete len:512 (+) Transcript_9399:73-1608(+)